MTSVSFVLVPGLVSNLSVNVNDSLMMLTVDWSPPSLGTLDSYNVSWRPQFSLDLASNVTSELSFAIDVGGQYGYSYEVLVSATFQELQGPTEVRSAAIGIVCFV